MSSVPSARVGHSRPAPPGGSRARRPLRRPRAHRACLSGSAPRISGVSPKITRISSAPLFDRALRAASTACAVPRRSVCTAISARGSTCRASVPTASASGPITTAVSVQPASRTAPSTWASSERPPIACSTFGRAERMRVPSPAASTIARQVSVWPFESRSLAGGAVIARRDVAEKPPQAAVANAMQPRWLDSASVFNGLIRRSETR